MSVLDAAAAAAFPDRTVEALHEQDTRPGNETARVSFADGTDAYLKTATDGTDRLARETAATRYAARHAEVAVPAVLAADLDADPPYLATEPISGASVAERWRADDADRAHLARQVGRIAASVHEAVLDRAGHVSTTDGELGVDPAEWSVTLAETIEARADDWFADRFSDLPAALAAVVRDAAPLLEDADSVLLHGDLSRPNCHVDPCGVIDWERALAGDPALDVVDAVGHVVEQPDVPEADRERLRDALHDGYRAVAGRLPEGLEARRPVYRAVAYLLVPQTFEEWSAAVDRPTDDLAADVRSEFEARLDAARDAIPA